MSVYVSELRKKKPSDKWRWEWYAYLHSENRRELIDFSFEIGLHAYMFRNGPHFPHFRLTTSKRFQAIDRGAIPLDDDLFRSLVENSTACAEVQYGN